MNELQQTRVVGDCLPRLNAKLYVVPPDSAHVSVTSQSLFCQQSARCDHSGRETGLGSTTVLIGEDELWNYRSELVVLLLWK